MKKINKNRGFTLLELIISLAMIAIVTGAVLQIARFSDTHKSLTLARDQLRAVIRSAQSSSLSIPNPDGRHVCGYGIYVNNATDYELFYTFVETNVYEIDPNTCINDQTYRTYSGTAAGTSRDTIQNFNLKFSESSVNNLEFDVADRLRSIFFIAPYGEVFGNDGLQLLVAEDYTIHNTTNGGARSISVNQYGKID